MKVLENLKYKWMRYKLFSVFAICVLMLVVLNQYINPGVMRMSGVTESRNVNLTLQKPAEIKEILVTIGQHVEAGQEIVILENSELMINQNRVFHELKQLEAEQKIQKDIHSMTKTELQSASTDPLRIKIESLKRELELINGEIDKSRMIAPTTGTITAITRTAGEYLPAFTPVITINPDAPKYAVAYIPEQNTGPMKRGDIVDVYSATDTNKKSSGQIIGFGNSVVPFNERLQPAPQANVLWGRELFVELANNNPFLSGEKIIVIFPTQNGSGKGHPGLFMVKN